MPSNGSKKLPRFWIYYCLITGSFMLLQAGYFALCYIFPSLGGIVVNELMTNLAFSVMLASMVNAIPLFFSSIFFFIERRWFIAGLCLSAISAYIWLLLRFADEL